MHIIKLVYKSSFVFPSFSTYQLFWKLPSVTLSTPLPDALKIQFNLNSFHFKIFTSLFF